MMVYEEYLSDDLKVGNNNTNDMDSYYEYVKNNSDINFLYPKNELDVFKKDFKKTNTINRGTLGSTLQSELIKNSDEIVVELVTDYFYDVIRIIKFLMKNIES